MTNIENEDYSLLYDEAIELEKKFEFDECIEKYNEVIEKIESIDQTSDSRAKLVMALNNKAEILDITGEIKEALRVYKRAYNISKKTDDKVNLLKSVIGIGKILDFLGNTDKALEFFKEGSNLYTGLDGKKYQAKCKDLSALIYSREGKMNLAREELNQAFALITDMEDDENIRISSAILNQLGLIDFRKGNYEKAMEFFQKAISITKNIEFCIERGVALRYKAVILSIKKQFWEAFENHLTALRIFKKNKFAFGLAKVYYSLGQAYTDIELYDQSIYFLKESAKIFNYLHSKSNIAVIYGKIGTLYMKLKDYDEAIKYFQKDLKLSLELDYQRGLAHTYRNLGDTYMATERTKEVISFYKKSIELFRKFNDERNLADVYLKIAKAYLLIGEVANAREFANWALELFKLSNRNSEIGQVYLLFGRIESELDNWEDSLSSFVSAINILENTSNYSDTCVVKFSIARLIYKTGKKEESLTALKEALDYADKYNLHFVRKSILDFIQTIDEELLLEITISKFK